MTLQTSSDNQHVEPRPLSPSGPDELFPWLPGIEQRLDKLMAESEVPVVVVLEGGHFDPNRGADEFSRYSLQAVLELATRMIRRQRMRIVFGILVDDLGLECSGTHCKIDTPSGDPAADQKQLPDALEEILADCRYVKRDRVLVTTERNARNRGLDSLKRLMREEPETCADLLRVDRDGEQGTVYLKASDGTPVLIAKQRGQSWTAQCPLIMGQHYTDVFRQVGKRFQTGFSVVIVDLCEFTDRNKVNRGSELALSFLTPRGEGYRHIVNVFLEGARGEICIVDEHSQADFDQA